MRGVVLEFFHARAEPLVGIVVIVGDAGAENVQERESRMLDTLLNQLGEMLLFGAVTARDEGSARGQSQGNGINRRFDVAKGHAFRLHADATGWRRLAGGQAVDLVVHDDVEQVHIAAHGVDEMVAADAETVTVAASHEHGEFMIGELQTGGHGEGTAVEGVHAVGIHVAGKIGGTSDAADGDDVVVRYAEFDEGFLYGSKHTEIAASGTPVRIDSAFHIGHGQLTGTLYGCRHFAFPPQTVISCMGTESFVCPASCSFTASTMWCGMKGSPSYLRMWPSGTKLVSLRR